MSVNPRARHVMLPFSIIVVLTVVSCADPAAPDSSGVIPWSSSAPAPDNGFSAPPPEPTGPLSGDDTNANPGGNPPPNGGTNSNPGGNPPANGGTNPNPDGSPPPEPTGPPPGGGTNTNPGDRTVTVAGPTPDNRYQERAWGVFTRSGQEQCASITNRRGQVDVSINGVRFVDQQPANPTIFRVFSPSECSGESERSVGSCLNDPILSPYEEGRGPDCLIGIVTDAELDTKDYTATLVYDLATVCTTTTVSPCDDAKVRERAPSPSAPVRVTWQYTEPIVACFKARPHPAEGPHYAEESSHPPRCPARDGS